MNLIPGQRLRVLLLEDSVDDAALVELELRRGGGAPEVVRVDTPAALREALERREFDLVIADWNMPGFDALDGLTLVREAGLDLPFIIVSGAIGEQTAVEAMRAGVHDYVMKDDLTRLLPAIERELPAAAERRRLAGAEAALRESEERYRLVAENASDLIRMYGPDWVCRYASPASRTLLGVEPEELVGTPASARMHPDDAGWLEFERAAAVDFISGYTVRHRERRANGTYVWIEESIRAVYDRSGREVLEIVSVARDMTERKREELGAQRLAAIVEWCGDAVIAVSPAGSILSWNRGARSLFGYVAAEALGQPVAMLSPPGAGEEWIEVHERVMATRVPERHQAVRTAKNGMRVSVEVTISPTAGETGPVTGVSLVVRTPVRTAASAGEDALFAGI